MIWNGMNISGIDMVATGKKISRLIDESGLTDKKLGEIMGLSVQSINKWRHGRNLPDIENLFILSRILGIKVDDFLVPFVAAPRHEFEFMFEPGGFSDSTLRRLWAYFIRLN
ncbi:MAG: helix-turn-helix domain-containing protein [Lachnospiraceae bacterium]